MPSELLIQDAAGSSLSPIVFGVDASLNPVDDGTNFTDDVGTDTCDVVLTLAGVASAAGRQSTKVDLGAVRAPEYSLFGCVDYTDETPVIGQSVDYHWAPSTNATNANGNVAGNSGVDDDAPGGALGSITLAAFLKQCFLIGSLVLDDAAGVQNGFVGILRPPTRYGQLIVVNNGGDAFEDDDVEMHQVLVPIVPEGQ
jgi:hypothetical protein